MKPVAPIFPPFASVPQPRGFTLVELLTVIGIVGILAAIIIPVVGRVRANARIVECASNLRQVGGAMFLYAADHKNRWPAQKNSSGVAVTQVADPLLATTLDESWIRGVAGYLSVRDQTQLNQTLCCPNVQPEQSATQPFSYAMNKFLQDQLLVAMSRASKTVLVRHTGLSRSSFIVEGDKSEGPGDLVYSDISGDFNYLFADGHVERRTPLLGAAYWVP